jgi:hypothetical protein
VRTSTVEYNISHVVGISTVINGVPFNPAQAYYPAGVFQPPMPRPYHNAARVPNHVAHHAAGPVANGFAAPSNAGGLAQGVVGYAADNMVGGNGFSASNHHTYGNPVKQEEDSDAEYEVESKDDSATDDGPTEKRHRTN